MSDNGLGLPYKPKTPQVKGRDSERKQAKVYGARVHPMSGAGSIKDDASNDEAIYEFKQANKTHVITASELDALFIRGCRAEKDAMYVVKFGNGIILEGRLRRG